MKLSRLDGMKWKELVSFMESNCHMLALESTPHEVSVAEVAYETSWEAGAGVAIAYRYFEVHGHQATAWLATSIYDKLTPHNTDIRNIRNMLSWNNSSRQDNLDDKIDWPIEPMKFNKRNKNKWGGLANVMFSISAAEYIDGNTCDKLATFAIKEFLDNGMKKRKSA